MIGLAAFIALAAAAPATTTPRQLPPVEQCKGDKAFEAFRAALKDAVARKGAAALHKLAAPGIIANFGGGSSWADFAQQWGLNDKPAESGIWKEMAGVMALGCARTEDGGRVFPGMFEAMGDDVDPFELLVARPGTKLRASPSADAKVVATLDWSAATLVEGKAPEGWSEIWLLRSATRGWAENASLISPLGYRLVAERQGDRWVITAFVAGD